MKGFLTAALLLSLPAAGFPTGTEMEEYHVKALFLYNFTQFIEWPAEAFKDAGAPLTICVVAPTPFEDGELDRVLKGKKSDTHPLLTRTIRDGAQAAGCHIVFLSTGAVKKGKGVLVDSKQAGVLTVGEVPGFASGGGVINFLIKEGRVKLEINTSSAERNKLKISAKLLKLAEIFR